MPRPLGKLTALQVSKLAKPGLYGDGGGLTLQITKAGVKSWLFRFMRDGKAHGMGLGPLHTVSLAEAREKALAARKLLHDGINPLTAKKESRMAAALERAKSMTFDQCAEAYIEAHKASWKNPKHQDQWANTLKTYASPVFGSLSVADVDTALIVKCLSPIWESKTETASRLRGRIESVLGWATTSGYRSGDNPARWRGHLENLLANISKTSRTKHLASLPYQRVGEFIQALRTREGMAARALEFAILTACRSGEVRGARWSEFDLDAKVWTIPAERMKAKREHQVPLSPAAMKLLDAMTLTEGLVFSRTEQTMLSDMALTAVIRRMNDDAKPKSDTAEESTRKQPRSDKLKPYWSDAQGDIITAHGFRSSFRMWAAETTNYPREVAEHALAHQLPDAVERAYQRGSQFIKRTALMEEWGQYCDSPPTHAVVKPINPTIKASPAKKHAAR